MKIRVINSKEDIETLKTNDKIIHLAFRPSTKDIMTLVSRCPSVKAIHVPNSYRKTMSESIQMFLIIQKVALLEGDVWGNRTDINKHYEIPKELISVIKELKGNNVSTEDIISYVRDTKLSADLVRFILNS
ncbi:MAG: DUF1699 family protein [Methanosarcinales archaeon]|jgi:hypothetical protein|nr:DUF1699 family protein [Methanosarcinales archaeon]